MVSMKMPSMEQGQEFQLEWVESPDTEIISHGFIACKAIDFRKILAEAKLSYIDLQGLPSVQKETLRKLKEHLLLKGYAVVCPEVSKRVH